MILYQNDTGYGSNRYIITLIIHKGHNLPKKHETYCIKFRKNVLKTERICNKMHRCRQVISLLGCEQTYYSERSKRPVSVGA